MPEKQYIYAVARIRSKELQLWMISLLISLWLLQAIMSV